VRCEALAAWCRLDVSAVDVLDLVYLFPTTPSDWFVHDPDTPSRVARFEPVPRLRFCLACLREQQQRGTPFHLPATWSLAWLTHCPRHQSWFQDACFGCYRSDALDVGAAGHGLLCCRFCGASLDLPAHTATLTPVLQLQHTLLACSLMQAPDSSWVGRCGPRAFLQLTHDLLQLVMLRDEYDSAILADYLPERDWDYPRLRLRAHHRFPTLNASERFALLSAVVALLRGTSAPGPRAMDPLTRLWQALTPHRRQALTKLGRRWPQRIRWRLLNAMTGCHSTIQLHRYTI
jgi:TniQ protein